MPRGYFIYGSIDCGIGCGNGDPDEYKLGPDGKLIVGLDELLTGRGVCSHHDVKP